MKVEAMPSNKWMYYSLVGIVALWFYGCSSASDSGEVFVPGDEGHVDNWASVAFLRTAVFHGSEVRDGSTTLPVAGSELNVELCMDCHGAELDGGIARISCFSCHNGPDGLIRRPQHPPAWLADQEDVVHFHGSYARDFPTSCTSFCHGDTLTGSIGPSCFDCHAAGELEEILEDIAVADQP